MTVKATRKAAPAPAPIPIETLERFTPEQVVAMGLTPYRLSTLKKKAQKREIHHHRDGMKITFTREDLRKNAELGEAAPLAIGA